MTIPEPPSSHHLRRARPLLGTLVDISVTGPATVLSAAIDAAFAAIENIHTLMSFHDPASDVSRINRLAVGESISVDPHTYQVLQHARMLGDASHGMFDIAIADVLMLKGFLPQLPQFSAYENTHPATYRELELDADHSVHWLRKGWIDLGGIAKGYAVDCAIAALREFPIEDVCVNAGGDIACFGAPQMMHVRHPTDPQSLIQLGSLQDAAIATSAGYFSEREHNGDMLHPLVTPGARTCTPWNASISVVASDCISADALTKIVRLSIEQALPILERFNAQALIVNEEGIRTYGVEHLS